MESPLPKPARLHAEGGSLSLADAERLDRHPPCQAGPNAASPPGPLAGAAATAGPRPSSLPQPLAGVTQQHAGTGSGPNAPVSPNPAVPPALRRVSSQPPLALPSGDSSLHSHLAATGSGPAGDEATSSMHPSLSRSVSREGSRSSRRSSGSGYGPTAALRGPAPPSLTAVAAAAALKAAPVQHERSPTTQWHPALSSPPQAALQRHQPLQALPDDAAAAAVSPLALAAALQRAVDAAAGEEEDELPSPVDAAQACMITRQPSASLLTFLLRGPSAASSAAASASQSREVSVRAGAVSREASLRGVSRR